MFRIHVTAAIFWRNFTQYFTSVLGYLFIFVFVTLCAILTFSPRFFADNLANLDQLSTYFPVLLLFLVPAITMTTWADEKKQGTDALLFTLPASDMEIVAGKYLGVVAVYTVALLFSGTQLVALSTLGAPDWGVIAANYFGYWLAGIAMLAIGMFASSITGSTTVAFVVGAVLCAIPVLIGYLFEGNRAVEAYGVGPQLRDFKLGLVSLPGVVYFLTIAAFMLYLNLVVISKRHWSRGQSVTLAGHFAVRVLCLAVALVSLNVIADRSSAMMETRLDLTAENLFTLDATTEEVIQRAADNERRITIQAFVSSEVPRKYVETRKRFLGLLNQYDRLGGKYLDVRLVELTPNSPEIDDARSWGIYPQLVRETVGGRSVEQDVYMGAVIKSSVSRVVLPFIDGDMAIEYELTRSIATATDKSRKLRIGILETDVRFNNIQYEDRVYDWIAPATVDELSRQYELVDIAADKLPEYLKLAQAAPEPDADTDEKPNADAAENDQEGKDGNSEGTTDAVESEPGMLTPRPENDPSEGEDESQAGEPGDSETEGEADTDSKTSNEEPIDVLIVADPSSLTKSGMANLVAWVEAGQPTLIMADPLTFYFSVYQAPLDLGIINAPSMPRVQPGSRWDPVATTSEPKADNGRATALLDALGIQWKHDEVVWNSQSSRLDFEPVVPDRFGLRWPENWGPRAAAMLFVRSEGTHEAFNRSNGITAGLQELLFSYAGSIAPVQDAGTEFAPLVTLRKGSAGHYTWQELTEDLVRTRREFDQFTGEVREVTGPVPSPVTNNNIRIIRATPELEAARQDDDEADDANDEPAVNPADGELADVTSDGAAANSDTPASSMDAPAGEEDKGDAKRVRSKIDDRAHCLAAYITGRRKPSASPVDDTADSDGDSADGDNPNATDDEGPSLNVVFVADIDFATDFVRDQQAGTETRFDNFIFLVNAIETLAGESDFVRLRNRRPLPRTLTTIELATEPYRLEAAISQDRLDAEINQKLADAEERLGKAAEKISNDDQMTLQQKIQAAGLSVASEQRKFEKETEKLERQREQVTDQILAKKQEAIDWVEGRARWTAILGAGLPALLLGAVVLFLRKVREMKHIDPERRVAGSTG